jgi:hypothetical protein
MSIEAMKQALDALYDIEATGVPVGHIDLVIDTLRTAIEHTEKQEPVAWQVHPFDYGIGHEGVYARTDRPEQVEMWKRKGWAVQPLYTTPQPQREWVGLTDDEVTQQVGDSQVLRDVVRAVEHVLKEKNYE